MALSRKRHDTQDALEAELEHLDRSKENAIIRATRAPTSTDSGQVWIFKDGNTLKLYLRDWVAGIWKGPQNFT